MKSFDDFYQSITQEHQDEWSRELNARMLQIRLPLTDETVEEFLSFVLNSNIEMMFKILRQYHEWLSD